MWILHCFTMLYQHFVICCEWRSACIDCCWNPSGLAAPIGSFKQCTATGDLQYQHFKNMIRVEQKKIVDPQKTNYKNHVYVFCTICVYLYYVYVYKYVNICIYIYICVSTCVNMYIYTQYCSNPHIL